MWKIIRSGFIIIAAAAAVTTGTYSFFSDTERSTGNVFTAGAIDLGIDNHSYYNGVLNQGTTWRVDYDISNSDQAGGPRQFFNFDDVKPSDYGEDTISLHVNNNDAWLCADVTLTANDDVDCNTPETLAEGLGVCENSLPAANADGDLAQEINFLWWADDGDNVLEEGEKVMATGPLGALDVGATATVALADADENIWTGSGPLPGDAVRFVGKAWCFGAIAPAPLLQDGSGNARKPSENGDGHAPAGQPTDGGYTCDGSTVGNASQTDAVTLDISFRAVQARHNEKFQCQVIKPAKLTLAKVVKNENAGKANGQEWTLAATGPTSIAGTSGSPAVTNAEVSAGEYTLGESGGLPGYGASLYSCIVNGGGAATGNTLTLSPGDNAVCTITNTLNTCSAALRWADGFQDALQGVRKNGTAILGARSNPLAATGPNESSGNPYDNPAPADNTFFSLGFHPQNQPPGGSVVMTFTNNVIMNGPGNDVKLWEVTGGTSYPDEHLKLEASQDGSTWQTLAPDLTRDAAADLGSLAWAKYIRVTDVSPLAPFETTADGYDLDAVEALNCAQIPQ